MVKVLVVDDELTLRRLASRMVKRAEFEPVEAGDADEALRLLESRTDLRIVITDVDMPGSMNGLELAAIIGKRWPNIPVIITSGLYRTPSELPSKSVFFAKPYDREAVISTLKHMAEQLSYD